MGERKVLNKYIPADFDPQLVPRSKKPKDDLVTVRMMLPFTIQCATCSSFLYRGRKFNSKKESVKGVNGKYLGIQRFRFYIKCSACSRPITFLTDPQNTDYEMETGGTRNYEVWHDEKRTTAAHEAQTAEDEKLDSMKALENRVAESQREMAELDALEEIRAMNQRHVRLMKGGRRMDGAEAVLRAREEAAGRKGEEDLNEHGMTRDEEDLVQSIAFGASRAAAGDDDLRRLDEEDEARAERRRAAEAAAVSTHRPPAAKTRSDAPVFTVRRKKKRKPPAAPAVAPSVAKRGHAAAATEAAHDPRLEAGAGQESGGGALGGLLCYGTDSS